MDAAGAHDSPADTVVPLEAASPSLDCLDPRFGSQGIVQAPAPPSLGDSGFAVQADGKILVFGYDSVDYTTSAVRRFNVDGSIDTTFGTSGVGAIVRSTTYSGPRGIALQSDGKILVLWNDGITRFDGSGSLDSSFGTSGNSQFFPATLSRVMLVRPDDSLVLLGSYALVSPTAYSGMVAALTASGQVDTAFGSGGFMTTTPGLPEAFAVGALQTDGRILGAGRKTETIASGYRAFPVLARFTVDGAVDETFGSSGVVSIDAFGNASIGPSGLAEQSTGSIVVSLIPDDAFGSDGASDDFMLRRYTASGQLDTTFGAGGSTQTDFFGASDKASALIVLPGGAILLAGTVTEPNDAGGVQEFGLARYTADGVLDTSFGVRGKVVTRFDGQAYTAVGARTMAREPNGTVIVAGSGQLPSADGSVRQVVDLVRYGCP